MTSSTRVGPQDNTRKGPGYQLDVLGENGSRKTTCYDTLGQLARAVCRLAFESEYLSRWHFLNAARRSEHWMSSHLRAYSPRGRALDVLHLFAYAEKLHAQRTYWALPGYVYRSTPVRATGGRRGGRGETPPRTFAERSLNSAWFAEEGEPEVRACRRENYLPTSWDGRWRKPQRCWKEQARGRKNWDR